MSPKQAVINPTHFLEELQQTVDTYDDLESNDRSALKLTRNNLKILAEHLKLGVKSSALKVEFQTPVILALNEAGLVSENLVECLEKNPNMSLLETSLLEESVVQQPAELETVEVIEARGRVETKQKELEIEAKQKELELEDRQKEHESQEKVKELELQHAQELRRVEAEAQAEQI